ncbi:hypothetical protein HR060_10600 [Catenovulum sp. SM1970]|uniref:hypothetical protein n=1 Tax=Marinifaba aquimaris TaxID=2741323 RepID=UPI0015749264|nr:hypothetical protein [Marinifaba aquimaris]NTS77313.1 hypothetical protein [Marinifaba aquimaris]
MTTKVGRPSKKPSEKKKGVYIKLPPWLIEWMDCQDHSNRALLIEEAMRSHFNINEDTRNEYQLDLCAEVERTYDRRYKRNKA